MTDMDKPEVLPVEVREIETVTGDFMTERGPSFWRIEIDGYCADFDYEAAANNFAAAINHRISSQARPDGELVERVAAALFKWDEDQALAASRELSDDPSLWLTWEDSNEPTRRPYRARARAAIAALSSERIAPQGEGLASFPREIGRKSLGSQLSDGETMCANCWDESGHDTKSDNNIPAGHAVYWDAPHPEYGDCDAYCIRHAIEAAESDAGWCQTCIAASLSAPTGERAPMRGPYRTECPHCGPLGPMEEHGVECPRYPAVLRGERAQTVAWQPISTAPRDCPILIENDRGMFVVEFDKDWPPDGWWMISDGKDFERPLRGEETWHWQKLRGEEPWHWQKLPQGRDHLASLTPSKEGE